MKKIAVVLVAAAIVGVPAFAAESDARRACENDVKSLCPGTQPGGGRIKECIKEHREQLSSGCKSALAEQQKQRQGNRSRERGNPTGSPNSAGE